MLQNAPIIFIDSNISVNVMRYVCELADKHKVPGNKCYSRFAPSELFFIVVWFDPTCVTKCTAAIQADVIHLIKYVSPNLSELNSMYEALEGKSLYVAGN